MKGKNDVTQNFKIISEDRAPGGRSNWLKLGEAMKVKAINGLVVTLEGKLMQQGLYKTSVRGTKYLVTPEGLWLIHVGIPDGWKHGFSEHVRGPCSLRPGMRWHTSG